MTLRNMQEKLENSKSSTYFDESQKVTKVLMFWKINFKNQNGKDVVNWHLEFKIIRTYFVNWISETI